jgi:extracellular elastinolytic metalloproteinase
MVHDIAYKYGFTESAFNFQETNFKHGGKGGDRVQLSVQNGEGFNNANFATPPE